MSRPIPILATPTPAARRAFLQAVYAEGFNWCGGRNNLDTGESPEYTHVYLRTDRAHPTKGPGVLFVENDEQLSDLMEQGTLVNSPRHFIEYVKRHSWKGDPTT